MKQSTPGILSPDDARGQKIPDRVVSKQIGSARLSFAEPEFMKELLDITPGSVSVLGSMNDTNYRVQLFIDRDALLATWCRHLEQ